MPYLVDGATCARATSGPEILSIGVVPDRRHRVHVMRVDDGSTGGDAIVMRHASADLAESGTPSLTDSAVIKYRRNIVSGTDMLDFEIGVYAANEALVLGDCLRSVDQAYAGYCAGITVILNGTRDNSVGVISSLRLQNADLRV
jgi:hypothetical protein